MVLEAPFALLLADQLAACLRGRSERIQTLAPLAILLLAIPYGTIEQRWRHPEGELNRRLARSLDAHFPDLQRGDCIEIRTQAPWDDDELYLWRYRAHNLPSVLYGREGIALHLERAPEASDHGCTARFLLGDDLELTAVRRARIR